MAQGEEGIHGFFDAGENGVDHFEGILFMPADLVSSFFFSLQGMDLPRLFVDLVEFNLVLGHGHTSAIEDNETRTGGTLVDSTDETIFQIIGTAGFILEQRAIAIVSLVGVDIDLRLQLLLFKSIVDIGHVKRVSHCDS